MYYSKKFYCIFFFFNQHTRDYTTNPCTVILHVHLFIKKFLVKAFTIFLLLSIGDQRNLLFLFCAKKYKKIKPSFSKGTVS